MYSLTAGDFQQELTTPASPQNTNRKFPSAAMHTHISKVKVVLPTSPAHRSVTDKELDAQKLQNEQSRWNCGRNAFCEGPARRVMQMLLSADEVLVRSQ